MISNNEDALYTFQTYDIEEFHRMIGLALRDKIKFSATAWGEEYCRYYVIRYWQTRRSDNDC